ncbi:MAG: UDP-N-acetylmuramate dehydrogenase [Bacteroidales bacterium]|nr:UDP-N-acetylmuramate dehydrogenase [Bacteroidales bacterium]
MKIESDYSLLSYNTFGLSASCRWFIEYTSLNELQTVLRDEYFREQSNLHIGRGSNLLFIDNFDGVVLHSAINDIEIRYEDENNIDVYVGSGVIWDDFVAYCVENNWYGAENLSLIPGEVGAAAVQNIGAYGVEIKNLIISVHVVDIMTGKEEWMDNKDCAYAYRDSIFKKELRGKKIIVGVKLRLSKEEKYILEYGNIKDRIMKTNGLSLATVRESIIAVRKEKLPDWKEYGNAGSYFMNPSVSMEQFELLKEKYPDIPGYPLGNDKIKVPAAWLIEQCGWKGKRIGDVGVWHNQPLVLINYGNATATDIALLAESVRESVLQKFDIEIYPEVLYV